MNPFPGVEGDITPVELAAELGHLEARPGLKVRNWLRKHVAPRLPSGHRWAIPAEVADRIRAHFRAL